ncbi:hypothetical protein FV139_16000 [Parahaliea maris]|uniref:Sulfotransferase family protein n=1 Tax=Parahaliea maris TaxID=2716870 RepID=A0A5C8ZUJ4_9GAMM|nr:sulfotransferase [Parahaliea maris]TXS91242.1 hypothetical protein FV139_16000 [Parahaliea maris]
MTQDSDTENATSFARQAEQAQHLLDAGQFDEAAVACVTLARGYPGEGISWHLLSTVSLALQRLPMAVDAALKSVQLDAGNARYFMQLARCYLVAQEWLQARKALGYAEGGNIGNDADALSQLGTLWFEANCLDQALACYNRALALDSAHTAGRFNRAATLRFQGDARRAEEDYRYLLQQHPADFEACHNLLQLRRFSCDENVLPLIDHCSDLNKGQWRAQVQLGYARGKYLEDVEAFEQAFDAYTRAADLKRQHTPYSVEKDLALMSGLPRLFETGPLADLVASGGDESAPQPIFVVGLPRTGTTLVERIIGSHSQVVSGGELNSLPLALLEAMGQNCFADPFRISLPDGESIGPEQLPGIRQRYLQLSRDRLTGPATSGRLVDKLPFNALYVGYILAAFPKASVVHVSRDPMDAALSNFKMLFAHGYDYSYNLDDLAAYLVEHRQMMQAWQRIFPGKLHEIRYEQLVADPQGHIQGLLDYCALPVEQACFDFHTNPEASQTASASQVRQPIHQRSVGHWRNFGAQLASLEKKFADAGMQRTL